MEVIDIWELFVKALNGSDRRSALAQAFDPAAQVRRYGYHGSRDEILEQFQGLEQLVAWLDRTPTTIAFELCPQTLAPLGQDQWTVRYRLTAPDDFVGGGLWLGRMGGDGRLVELEHRPDDLDPKYGAAVAERPLASHRSDHQHAHAHDHVQDRHHDHN